VADTVLTSSRRGSYLHKSVGIATVNYMKAVEENVPYEETIPYIMEFASSSIRVA
jgi:hypothetical protein